MEAAINGQVSLAFKNKRARNRTPEEKKRLLAEMERLREAGLTVKEAERRVGVPENVYYELRNYARLVKAEEEAAASRAHNPRRKRRRRSFTTPEQQEILRQAMDRMRQEEAAARATTPPAEEELPAGTGRQELIGVAVELLKLVVEELRKSG